MVPNSAQNITSTINKKFGKIRINSYKIEILVLPTLDFI